MAFIAPLFHLHLNELELHCSVPVYCFINVLLAYLEGMLYYTSVIYS